MNPSNCGKLKSLMYLRKEGDDYFIYVLGRNGEPRTRA